MRLAALSVLAAAACTTAATDPDDFPVEPTAAIDPAAGTSTGGTAAFSGRVCVMSSLRDLGSCSDTAGGLTVTLGDQVATTEADGSFAFETAPAGANLAFEVTGDAIVPTTTPFGPATTIRAVDADLWARELSSNGLELPDGSGAILGSVTTSAGDPVTGVSVESSPLGAAGPFYDGDGDAFVSDRTGARGVFFVPGIATGAADLTFQGIEGQPTLVNGVSVVNGGVTILDSVVMP